MPTDPRATYRLQVHAGFTLNDAAALVDYLSNLGISHIYTSPLLQAVTGSNHGYDVVDPTRVNTEVGDHDALDRLTATLKAADMGHILDIVPNHMAITGADNPWWWDVLENGPSSRYATFFDVEWNPTEARQENQVLVPVLGDHYGRVLENGELQLDFDGEHFVMRYYENSYPVDPRSLRTVLAAAAEDIDSEDLAFLADAYGWLPQPTATDRHSAQRRYRDQAVLSRLLRRLGMEQPSVLTGIDRAVNGLNADFDALDAFLGEQNYRLSFWRITQGELGYRRFFDINTLIGLRMEDDMVYAETHHLILKWLAEGRLDGLRIDHPDGLRDPARYFQQLHDADPDAWIVIEKILEPGEDLPSAWPVAGTTGYDFLNRVNGLFVDGDAEDTFNEIYARFTGETTDYAAVVRQKKFQVMREVLGSDVARLASLFEAVCERHRRHRDYTRSQLREAILEVAANLHVYRTYVHAERDEVPERDVHHIDEAIEAAKAHRPDLSADLFDFFHDLLLLRVRGPMATELVMRFQQFTGPVMAKGVEDTTFYNYNRFVSLNEVGGNPGHFGVSVEEFHAETAKMGKAWPRAMLGSSTHDTKRSEDVRARLNVLSEIPERWAAAVERWAGQTAGYKQKDFPDRNAEYLLYQNMVGAWPIDEERMIRYMEKATREAKVYTSWTNPNPDYEETVAGFIRSIYADEIFIADLTAFVDKIKEAGWINALAQTLIKLTAPGIPDIYQGTELWDFSLVDPDNRRPVDYAQRRRWLAEVESLAPESIWERAEEGLPKLWVTRQALNLRRQHPHWFDAESSYRPLIIPNAQNVVAYSRGEGILVVVPRFTLRYGQSWDGASLEIPNGEWHNAFTGEKHHGGRVSIADLLARFPVCLLAKI
jgi:(1->4)-alpha-D-glucan 1-alpha-D-glucosylmutase